MKRIILITFIILLINTIWTFRQYSKEIIYFQQCSEDLLRNEARLPKNNECQVQMKKTFLELFFSISKKIPHFNSP